MEIICFSPKIRRFYERVCKRIYVCWKNFTRAPTGAAPQKSRSTGCFSACWHRYIFGWLVKSSYFFCGCCRISNVTRISMWQLHAGRGRAWSFAWCDSPHISSVAGICDLLSLAGKLYPLFQHWLESRCWDFITSDQVPVLVRSGTFLSF